MQDRLIQGQIAEKVPLLRVRKTLPLPRRFSDEELRLQGRFHRIQRAKWITIFWRGLAPEELDGIFTTSFPFLISAPSTDAIWPGFQTDNS